MLLQMALFHSFLWLSNIPLCVCVCACARAHTHTHTHTHHIFFIHSSVDLGCFRVLAVVNIAAMNIGAFLFELEFLSFPDMCPGVGFLGHMVILFLVF